MLECGLVCRIFGQDLHFGRLVWIPKVSFIEIWNYQWWWDAVTSCTEVRKSLIEENDGNVTRGILNSINQLHIRGQSLLAGEANQGEGWDACGGGEVYKYSHVSNGYHVAVKKTACSCLSSLSHVASSFCEKMRRIISDVHFFAPWNSVARNGNL